MKLIKAYDNWVKAAEEKDRNHPKYNNSITDNEGRVAGFLGEICFAYLFGAKILDTFNHDVELNNQTIEVKTKRSSYVPQPHWLSSVAEQSEHQVPDYYAFFFVKYMDKKLTVPQGIYYAGGITYLDFWSKSTYLRKGEGDSSNNYSAHIPQNNIINSELDLTIFDFVV